MALRDDGIG